MKRILLSFLALLAITICNAQRVDLDRFQFKVTYRNLPQKPLGVDYKSFNVTPVFSQNLSKVYAPEEAVKNIKIEGFQYSDANPDLTLKLYADEIKIYSVTDKSQTTKVLGATVTTYWYEVEYSMDTRYELLDNKKGGTVVSDVLDTREKKLVYKSAPLPSKVAAAASAVVSSSLKANNPKAISDFASDRFMDYYSSINNSLADNYGYRVIAEDEMLWVLGEKKLADFEEYNRILNVVRDAFAQMTPNTSLELVSESLKPAIEYLNGIVPRFTTDEKNDKKMRYSAFYNLAKIYLFLDMPDDAIKMGNAIVTNDYDGGDGKKIIKEGNKLKHTFEMNKMTTRHFER